jgi:hypothetical protein
MELKELIRGMVEESLLIEEDKSHIIGKMNLHPKEKDTLINLFKTKPHLEKKIDWNKWRKLTFADFYEVMSHVSKSERKRKVKKLGIKGMKVNKDYLEADTSSFTTGADTMESGDLLGAYIPLNHEASKLIASDKVGSCVGEWCTAMNDINYWNDYINKDRCVLIYLVYENTKYAVITGPNTDELFNAEDDSVTTLPGYQRWTSIITDNAKTISKANDLIERPLTYQEAEATLISAVKTDEAREIIDFDPYSEEEGAATIVYEYCEKLESDIVVAYFQEDASWSVYSDGDELESSEDVNAIGRLLDNLFSE